MHPAIHLSYTYLERTHWNGQKRQRGNIFSFEKNMRSFTCCRGAPIRSRSSAAVDMLCRTYFIRKSGSDYSTRCIDVARSGGTRVTHVVVVSPDSPADVAYAPQRAADMGLPFQTSCLASFSDQTGPDAVGDSCTRSSSFNSLRRLPPALFTIVPQSLRIVRPSHLLVISVGTLLV